MTRPAGIVVLVGWSGLTALAAVAFLHGAARPVASLVCALAGVGVAVALRPTWASLPRFVTGWLAVGVATVTVLLGAAGSGLGSGLAYAVLRGPELTALLVVAGLLGSLVAALGYTHHRLAVEVAEQAVRVAQLRQRALESHLTALSAQINPHFLFNTFNTLAQVVHEDADAAEDLVTDLAHMMRYALRSASGWVPLREEIDVVRRLLRLEEARLGARLAWSVEADAAAGQVMVPGLLVQPLVENAVRHAVANRVEGGRVSLAARVAGERLVIVVEDDGPGLPPAIATAMHEPGRGTEGAGGGLYTTAERTRLAWSEGAATLTVGPGSDGRGTRFVLDVPTKGGVT